MRKRGLFQAKNSNNSVTTLSCHQVIVKLTRYTEYDYKMFHRYALRRGGRLSTYAHKVSGKGQKRKISLLAAKNIELQLSRDHI